MKTNIPLNVIAGSFIALLVRGVVRGSRSTDFKHIVATDLLEESDGNVDLAKMTCRQQYGEGSQITEQVCKLIDQYAIM